MHSRLIGKPPLQEPSSEIPLEIIVWTLAGAEKKTGSEKWGDQGQGKVRWGKEGKKEEFLEWRRGEEEHRRSERTKEHLSGLSALKEFATRGRYGRHKNIHWSGSQKLPIRILPSGEGTGAVQRSNQSGLKGRGKRKHQHLWFLLSYSYLPSSQRHHSCLQMKNVFA